MAGKLACFSMAVVASPQDVADESEVQEVEEAEAPIMASGAQEVYVAPEQDVMEEPELQDVLEEPHAPEIMKASGVGEVSEAPQAPEVIEASGLGKAREASEAPEVIEVSEEEEATKPLKAQAVVDKILEAAEEQDIIDIPEAQESIEGLSIQEDTDNDAPEVKEVVAGPEKQKAFLMPKEKIVYAQFDNYCVSQIGALLKRDWGHSTPGGLADCKTACNADEGCSGFEWYEAGWKKGYQCFLIRGGGHARRGAVYSRKFRDANCFVKNLVPNGQVGLVDN
eukprot:CAMPEP_0170591740 /NCGR_PEP_ID=MMETSP0224-20130122/12559_1 /TAXON_ID=285029 /ORGANISM="Togula jolla, Strain CCCM 725" /LENGTH=280 /DNA_ID=CAMNT_0010915613 /DNA_START=1 /DNA_END=844 /DNA_ORIENTATION=+